MKKWLLKSGLSLLAVGLIFSVIGRVMGGETTTQVKAFGQNLTLSCAPLSLSGLYGYSAGESKNVHSMSDLELDAFQVLEIDVDLGDISILTGDYGVELEWWGENYQLSFTNEGGTLKVRSSSSQPNFGFCGGKVTVYVPEGTVLDQLDVNADLGGVDLDGIRVRQADLTLSLGSLTGYDLTVTDKLTVEADLGDVDLSGDLRGLVDVQASLGSVELDLSGPASEYSYDVKVSLGEIWVDGNEHVGEHISGGRGSTVIQINADLGDVELYFDA